VRLEAVAFQQLQQPPPAERGLVRRRGARRQPADHRQDGLGAVGDVAVGEHLATFIDHRHLGTLAVDRRFRRRQTSRASFPSSYVIPET
jgi:hypothetical protein